MENLESRIRALEASNRRQRYSIIGLAAIIVGGTLVVAMRPIGDAKFDTVTCKAWKLVDNDGKVRMFANTSDSDAGMVWTDKNGRVRMRAVTCINGQAGIGWHDTDGNGRMIVKTEADGLADMAWYDKDGKVRIMAATNRDFTSLPTKVLKP